jgi:hypothetical protein
MVDIVFLVAHQGRAVLLGMTTTRGQQPPHLADDTDDDPPLVPSA